ncbi:MAG: hypothetical protein WCF84_02110 [Anaerolineae bacterium]
MFAALGLFWITLLCLLVLSLKENKGLLVYALDDAYIHMAIAKHFAQNTTWGVTRYAFSSSSSSPLWVLLLASAYALVGVNDWVPFILNLVSSTGLVLLAYILLRQYRATSRATGAALVTMIFVAPLPTLVFIGMEHTLHALLTLAFVFCAAQALSPSSDQNHRAALALLALTPLITAIRLEGLFPIVAVSLLFIIQRRFITAFALVGLGAMPVVAYGWVSIAHGWYFLANSILLKSPLFDAVGIIDKLKLIAFQMPERIEFTPHLLWLVLGSALLVIRQLFAKTPRDARILSLNVIFILSTLFHLMSAGLGWFYRYEAYLVILGVMVIAASLVSSIPTSLHLPVERKWMPAYPAILLVAFLVLEPFGDRAWSALTQTPRATTNIYQQQYQMGLFLERFYPGEPVLANDIGAIDYLADIHLVDLAGLGTRQIGELTLTSKMDMPALETIVSTEQVRIAIVYTDFLAARVGIPSRWVKVGEWKIRNNIVCTGDTVSFYAVDPGQVSYLHFSLQQFAEQLPAEVLKK